MWRGAGGTTRREQRGGKDGPQGTVADLEIEFAGGISRFDGCYGGAQRESPPRYRRESSVSIFHRLSRSF
jgi:hypothetical protein